jgi:hypothetical protein
VQPDNTITVQNLGSKPADSSDDASTVVLCPDQGPLEDAFVEMYAPVNSAQMPSGCVVQTLMAEFVYNTVPTTPTTSATSLATTTTTSDTLSSTTTTSSPSVSACVPVPDGQEFRVSVIGGSEYLNAAAGASGTTPDDQTLVTTTDYNQALPFKAAPGRDGQITFVKADGTTLYSDQDLGSNGDGPVYFDDLDTFQNSNMFPVQFCLQSDDTFVVQNLGNDKQNPADDANVVQICSTDGAVYLYTADRALTSGCRTVRLQIAPVPNRFRMRLASNSQYLSTKSSSAVPTSEEILFYQTADAANALIFENVPGQPGRIVVYNLAGTALYPNQNSPSAADGIFANPQAAIDANNYNLVLFFVQPDGTITVQNNGSNPDSSDDANTVVLCPNVGYLAMYAAVNSAEMPQGCVVQTLTAEFLN